MLSCAYLPWPILSGVEWSVLVESYENWSLGRSGNPLFFDMLDRCRPMLGMTMVPALPPRLLLPFRTLH